MYWEWKIIGHLKQHYDGLHQEEETGRPKTTWRRSVEMELKEINLTWGEAEKIAKNKEEWKEICSSNI